MADDFWDSIFARDTFAQPFDIETLPDRTRMPIQRSPSLTWATEPNWRARRERLLRDGPGELVIDANMPRDTIIAVDSRVGEPTTITWPQWETYYPTHNGYERVEWQPGARPPNAIRAEMQRTLDAIRRSGMASDNAEIFADGAGSVSEAPPPAVFPEPPETEVEMPQFDEDDMSLIARIGRLNMNRADRIAHINNVGEGHSPNAVRIHLYNRLVPKAVKQTRGWF